MQRVRGDRFHVSVMGFSFRCCFIKHNEVLGGEVVFPCGK